MEWFEAIFEIFGSAFLKKIEVKGGHGVESGKFGKQNFFLNINFLLDSILFFMYYGHFPPKSSQKLTFVLFKPEKVPAQQRSRTPVEPRLSQIWKGQISILGYL